MRRSVGGIEVHALHESVGRREEEFIFFIFGYCGVVSDALYDSTANFTVRPELVEGRATEYSFHLFYEGVFAEPFKLHENASRPYLRFFAAKRGLYAGLFAGDI